MSCTYGRPFRPRRTCKTRPSQNLQVGIAASLSSFFSEKLGDSQRNLDCGDAIFAEFLNGVFFGDAINHGDEFDFGWFRNILTGFLSI